MIPKGKAVCWGQGDHICTLIDAFSDSQHGKFMNRFINIPYPLGSDSKHILWQFVNAFTHKRMTSLSKLIITSKFHSLRDLIHRIFRISSIAFLKKKKSFQNEEFITAYHFSFLSIIFIIIRVKMCSRNQKLLMQLNYSSYKVFSSTFFF